MPLTLSVLDQSPIRPGATAAMALRETIELAQLADRLGYARYWLAEHHASAAFAGTAPEILIGQVARETSRIRVGSGGVMLTHYSPLKVAECFRVLEALYPGRVDLGIGRAPGGTTRTAQALAHRGGPPPETKEALLTAVENFPAQLRELQGYLEDNKGPEHPFPAVRAMPQGPGAPELWLLGSGGESAGYAADIGAGYCYAHFINPGGEALVDDYRRRFRPAARRAEAEAAIAALALCAETEAEARRLALPVQLWGMRALSAPGGGFPTAAEVEAYLPQLSAEERALLEARAAQGAIGTPEQVAHKLTELARGYGVREVFVLTITLDAEARRRSYTLLAEACGIGRDA